MTRLVKRSLIVVGILLALAVALVPLKHELVSAATPTFSKEVARILQNKCQSCHHPGDIAPFSLMTYNDTKRLTGAIKDAIVAKRMPPWKPLPSCGNFKDVRQLTDAEVATIMRYEDGRYSDFLKLCLLTGQRRSEVASIRQAWLAGDTLTIPASVAKNGKEHVTAFNLLTALHLPKVLRITTHH